MSNTEILEDDYLFVDDEYSQDSTSDEIPRKERYLRAQAYPFSVSELVNKVNKEDIILTPEYQRGYVWDNKKASLLIESLLLNVPIPVMYMSEEKDGTWSVVDGLQRLYSLQRFFNNELKLIGLDVLQELNGLLHDDLSPRAKRILNYGILRIILIFKKSHPEIKYDIFMRLNRGSIKLAEQELRNCLYRGKFNNLLKELRENPTFLSMLGLKKPHKRMLDAELILRFFAIADAYQNDPRQLSRYTGKMKSALNKYMEYQKHISSDERKHLKQRFEDTIDKVYAVFAEHAFQRIHEDGEFDSRKVNRSIMDCIMVSFEPIEKDVLLSHKNDIHDLLRRLPLDDSRFDDSITKATSGKRQLLYRLKIWHEELHALLEK